MAIVIEILRDQGLRALPTASGAAGVNVPPALPINTVTVPAAASVTARSRLWSPLKSAATIAEGCEPMPDENP